MRLFAALALACFSAVFLSCLLHLTKDLVLERRYTCRTTRFSTRFYETFFKSYIFLTCHLWEASLGGPAQEEIRTLLVLCIILQFPQQGLKVASTLVSNFFIIRYKLLKCSTFLAKFIFLYTNAQANQPKNFPIVETLNFRKISFTATL